jgi:dienelactone hydrolase
MGLGADGVPAPRTGGYDPFVRGRFPVGVRTIHALDRARDRTFPCEVGYPAEGQHAGHDAVRDAAAQTGIRPLVAFSHHSGGNRTSATFLATHLSSHRYVVAAMDHSDLVAAELQRTDGESDEQRAARVQGWIANRVPDIRFLLDHLLAGASKELDAMVDPSRIGIVGHSFGGWTALAAPAADGRLGSVVALAPAGSSKQRPGIIPATLTFDWRRAVPTRYLVGELDTALPLDGMHELFDRTPPPRQMVILRRADHLHFVDDVEREHEAMRAIPATGELAWINQMRPIDELCSGEPAHRFVRGLTLAHMDATLRGDERARRFLGGDLRAELAERGVDATSQGPRPPASDRPRSRPRV